MGQKVNPNGFRYGITKEHEVNWYAEKKEYADFVIQDSKIREYIKKFTRKYMIGKIEIIRTSEKNEVTVNVHSARIGALLGNNGDNLKLFTKNLNKHIKNRKLVININAISIDRPELNATLVAEEIALKLENRGSFRMAQKFAMRNTLKAGATGIKTSVSGRLNGADMARTEGYTRGTMKLHTLRQDVDFAKSTARTTYGAIGIKVWISKGDVHNKAKNKGGVK